MRSDSGDWSSSTIANAARLKVSGWAVAATYTARVKV